MASSIAMLNAELGSVSYIAIPVGRAGTEVSVSLKHPSLEAYWTSAAGDPFNRVITQTTTSSDGSTITTYTVVAKVTFGMGLLSTARTHAPARIEQIEPAPVESDILIDGSNVGIPNVDVFIFP